jgi:Holliday junction DNA helicase RuvA
MYEYISGLVADLAPTYAVIDAGGVGYYVNISLQTYSAIEGEKSARLYVHFVVREDAQLLYGFATKLERELFRHLISVSGVGGNTARMILSTYSTAELRNIIATENAVLLKNVKGLGLKTAQKIIVELSGKMLELGADKDISPVAAANQSNEVVDETVAALVMLGFQKGASEKVVKAILNENPAISVEEAVRQALRRL